MNQLNNQEAMHLISEVKIKLLKRINVALSNPEIKLSAETIGYFLNGTAKFEENLVLAAKDPLTYDQVVDDVSAIVDKLATGSNTTSEKI